MFQYFILWNMVFLKQHARCESSEKCFWIRGSVVKKVSLVHKHYSFYIAV